MTFQGPHAAYMRTQQREEHDLGDAHNLVSITLTEFLRSLSVLNSEVDLSHEVRNRHLARSFTALYILQDSLDFDKGGDIALNLFRIYEFTRQQLLAYGRREKVDLSVPHRAMSEILDAWNAIGQE